MCECDNKRGCNKCIVCDEPAVWRFNMRWALCDKCYAEVMKEIEEGE